MINAQMTESKQIIVWKSSYMNTTEFVTVKTGNSILVNGHITGEGFGKLFQASYNLEVNPQWNTQSVHIDFQSDTSFTISLQKDKNNHWHNENGDLLSSFNECTDIDISLTPFTNTLPINRLNLPIGSFKEIIVIYIDLPTSECKPTRQRYTHLGKKLYKYEDLLSGFTSNIEIDEKGYVINYPGIWHRIFSANNSKSQLHQKMFFLPCYFQIILLRN